MRRRLLRSWALLGLAGLLAACLPFGPQRPEVTPKPRPAGLTPPSSEPSERSAALGLYYNRVEADLIAQGLLRTDGGGPDTPYTATDLQRNFEQIAFYDEYQRGAGLISASATPGYLRRWGAPVRFGVEFGTSVPRDQRVRDRAEVARYATRLARVTGHPIAVTDRSANFHVLYMGEDDRDQMLARVQDLVPNINASSMNILRAIPRSIHCLVIAFSDSGSDYEYRKAIALVRAEHPALLRRSCVHEELAQGLGLANDSPQARPSIFNDDDEFALLTTQDEMLLGLLYDRRLRPGMSLLEARPIITEILAEQNGSDI